MILLTTPQSIMQIPAVFKSLQETVLDCNRDFNTVIRDARTVFTSENAHKALDDWIFLVMKASTDIQGLYSKSKAGALNVCE